MNCKDKASIGWFPYVSFSGDVLGIPAREITTPERTVSGVQVKMCVRVVSVMFKSGHQKKLADAADAVSSGVDLFSDFPDPASDILIVEYVIIEEGSPWDLGA